MYCLKFSNLNGLINLYDHIYIAFFNTFNFCLSMVFAVTFSKLYYAHLQLQDQKVDRASILDKPIDLRLVPYPSQDQ